MNSRRALVLGGGGVTGIAWETGLLAGLAEAGIDLSSADVIVGTSAGSVVGAQISSGAKLNDLYHAQLADPTGEIAARMGPTTTLRFVAAMAWPGDEQRARARLGRAALKARTVPEAERRAVISKRLPSASWPERRLLITAVDAETGELRVFDRVVVLAPVTFALRRSARIATQLASLGAGVRSVVISPDSQARQAIGGNVLDPAHRVAAARAGHAQSAGVAESVAAIWS